MPILLTRPSGGAYVLGTRRWQHLSTMRGLTSSADVAPLALWRTRPHTPDEGRSSRVSMRAARATRTPRRASRRPVVRVPRARAALLTGNTSSSPTRRDELGGWEHAANGDEAVLGASDGVSVGAAAGRARCVQCTLRAIRARCRQQTKTIARDGQASADETAH